jgi:iron complex transport system permease protein
VLFLVSRREAPSGERLLLAGVAIATGASALEALMLAGGDLRLDALVAWMSGSTYRATATDAALALAGAAATLLMLPAAARRLEILPLGPPLARALGLDPARERVKLVALIALPIAAATLAMGPLSFVGLVGPHMARLIGFRRADGRRLVRPCAVLPLAASRRPDRRLHRRALFPVADVEDAMSGAASSRSRERGAGPSHSPP